nr:phosphopantothenoylcysteine decarboxylase-like [Tanacetum cinerariifolium]GFA32917.1 phosphopantothenoylcysteine decarboxylase-like [Tanacetum cinerariifolium]
MVFGPEHGGRTRGVGGEVGYKKGIEGYVRKKMTFKQRQDPEEIHNQVKKQVKEVVKSGEFWQEMREEMRKEMRAEFAELLAARQDDVQTPISKAPAKTAPPQHQRGPSTTRPATPIVSTIDQEMTSVEPVNNGSRKPRILLAASGSVDCTKFGSLCSCFSEWADVRAVATQAALHFIDKTSLPKDMILYTDEDEWSTWSKVGDPVLHVELRRWADVMVIAPLSANTLAKIAGGLCDNLLTSIVRAWDYGKPIFVAPAMNTFMWSNPLTEKHFMSIDELGITLLPPVSKKLACGDSGTGAMADPSDIFSCVKLFLELHPHVGTSYS